MEIQVIMSDAKKPATPMVTGMATNESKVARAVP
jgi:hypothetical protein